MSNFQLPEQKIENKNQELDEDAEIKLYSEMENKKLVQGNKVKQGNLLFYLNFDVKTAYIIGNSIAEQSDIFIPSCIKHDNKNYTITSIFKNSFRGSIMIKSVTFSPDSKLLIIGKNSFSNSSIESILIPPSLIQIHSEAFKDCKKLKNVEIPVDSKLQKIDYYSFYNTSIEKIFIPSKVSEIGKCAMIYCSKLKSIEFGENSTLQAIRTHMIASS